MKDNVQITMNSTISIHDKGKRIKKYGASSPNYPNAGTNPQYGIIKDAGLTLNYNNHIHKNMFLTTCRTIGGDSGGAFIINENTIVGFMAGARNESETTNINGKILYHESTAYPISQMFSAKIQPCT